MIVAFHYRQPFTRQMAVIDALSAGIGDDMLIPVAGSEPLPNAHALVLFGVGGMNREIWDSYEGRPRILIDKGYARKGFMRVTINEFHPIRWLQLADPPADRLQATGWQTKPYSLDGTHILLDGLSGKYCHWFGFDRDEWVRDAVKAIRMASDLPILVRPRPSHNPPPPVPEGTILDVGPLADSLAKARVVISHGGNLGCDAVINGRAHCAFGPSPARTLSGPIDPPHVPSEKERHRWMKALAYCQYSMDEIADGTMWKWVRGQL